MRLILSTLLLSGCGSFSRAALFSDTPAFDLEALPTDAGVLLAAYGYELDWTEDVLCDEDDGDSCSDDLFVGFAFYRSDDGPYGSYVELGITPEPELLDELEAGPDTAWRAAILRKEADADYARVEQVSIAVRLLVEP